MNAGADADVEPVRPRVLAEHPLDRERRVEGVGRCAGNWRNIRRRVRVDLVTTGGSDGASQDLPRLAQHRRVATSKPAEEFGMSPSMSVMRNVYRQVPVGSTLRSAGLGARSDRICPVMKTRGDDAVPLGCFQEADACTFPRFVAFERDTFRKGASALRTCHSSWMRKPSSPLRVDIGERAVRQVPSAPRS